MPKHPSPLRRPPVRVLLSGLALLVLAALPAAAQPAFSLGPRASTAGLGVEVALATGEAVGVRLAAGTGSLDFEVDSDQVTYDGEVDLSNVLAVVDLHPGRGAFRLSLGALVNDNRFRGEAPIRELLLDEGIQVPGGLDLGVVRATAEVDEVAPYAGIGWGPSPRNRHTGGWHASVDLGVAWHGEPDVTLEVLTPIPIGLIPGGQALLDQALENERRSLQDEVRDYEFFPVVALSLGYGF